jgi:hypothetical protein
MKCAACGYDGAAKFIQLKELLVDKDGGKWDAAACPNCTTVRLDGFYKQPSDCNSAECKCLS